jgi:hypothetical protein
MQELRNLYVLVIDPSPHEIWEGSWLELEEQLLEAAKNVTKPREFELMLPFKSCRTDWDMGESRCVLKKPEGGAVEDEEED